MNTKPSNNVKTNVLFVCMGNICRSPTAEGVFRSVVDVEQLSQLIDCDSAGTHAYHIGNSPDSRSQATAKNHNVDLSNLVARKVTTKDFDAFDYIIAMDKDNLTNLKDIQKSIPASSKALVHLFMEFASNWDNDQVPDPYYGGNNGFEQVYKMVSDASKGLLEHIRKE